MLRQYRIVTKTPESDEQMLQPGVHAALYNIPEVRDCVTFLETQPHVEMIGIRLGSRFYGIVVIHAPELQEHHFQVRDFSQGA